MNTPVGTVRFLAVANHFARLARTVEEGNQRMNQFEAERMAAFERMNDRHIELLSVEAALAVREMAKLQLQKRVRQMHPKYNRLTRVLAQATANFTVACRDNEEEILFAGKDYSVAFEERKALNAKLEELGSRVTELEAERKALQSRLEGLKLLLGQAQQEYGETELTLDGFRQTLPTAHDLQQAELAAQQAAVALFGTKK